MKTARCAANGKFHGPKKRKSRNVTQKSAEVVEGYRCRDWKEAQRLSNGREQTTPTESEMEQWLEAQAAEYADRLSKAFGTKLSSNIELAARALEVYFGRRLPDLVQALADFVPETDADEEAPF